MDQHEPDNSLIDGPNQSTVKPSESDALLERWRKATIDWEDARRYHRLVMDSHASVNGDEGREDIRQADERLDEACTKLQRLRELIDARREWSGT